MKFYPLPQATQRVKTAPSRWRQEQPKPTHELYYQSRLTVIVNGYEFPAYVGIMRELGSNIYSGRHTRFSRKTAEENWKLIARPIAGWADLFRQNLEESEDKVISQAEYLLILSQMQRAVGEQRVQ